MNTADDSLGFDAESRPASTGPAGRRPDTELAATLRSQVAAVMRVLDAGAAEGARMSSGASPFLFERYQAPLAEAMVALGETLADFFEESTEPVDMDGLRSEFLEPILAISRHLPVIRRAQAWNTEHEEASDLQQILFERLPGGFDARSLLLSNFYQQGKGAASVYSRVVAVMRMMREELTARGAFAGRTVRVLVLGSNAVSGLDVAMTRGQIRPSDLRPSVSLLIVDPAGQALRRVRQTIEDVFNTRAAVLLCSPIALAQHPNRPRQPFDIVYAFSQYDVLPEERALAFTESIMPFLKPGGVLLTGSYLPDVVRADRALSLALVGISWEEWDETKWKRLLSALPFDLEASRFEIHPPATLAVLARRKAEESA